MLHLNVNGASRKLDVARETPLLWVLRDVLQLKGTKYGCGVGVCGICTVLANGEPLRSCVVPLGEVIDRKITTIEGLAEQGHPVLSAWIGEQVPQCGYCQPGQVLTAAALLDRHQNPGETQINAAMGGVLCRCGTYQRIRRALKVAAKQSDALVQPPTTSPKPVAPAIALDDWIRIGSDGTVTVTINHSEMGQGVTTALATLVAEELHVEMVQMQTEFAPADSRYRNPLFKEQTTGGSTSVRGEWKRLSLAGACARERLIQAAARHWGVRAEECEAAQGAVIHRHTGRRLGYGDLADKAQSIQPPPDVKLKRPEQRRLLGRALPRLEVPDMAAGRTVYGMDLSLPGMRVATVLRCPIINGSVQDFDAKGTLAVPGVERVLRITNGVVVVAKNTWSALQGREKLEVRWDLGARANLSTAAIFAQLTAALEQPGEVRQHVGRVEPAFRHRNQLVEADFATAHLAHAALEPMNCVARLTHDGCEIWVGTQSPEGARETASRVTGLPLEKIQVHTLYLGGSFGRRLASDMVAEAVEIAAATGWPVQVVWTRADDMQHDHYRPAHTARLRAALDADGWPLVWFQRSAGPAITGEGSSSLTYAIPNVRSEFVELPSPAPTGAWRAVGAGQDAFVVESFIDELAHTAGRDPFEYRRALLRDAPRQRATLELAAAKAGWSTPPPAGRYRGIAVYKSFGSYVAEVAEVSISNSAIHVHRVVCAIDCGGIINPDIIRAQLEGAIAFGLSAALKESITIEQGRVVQQTYDDYPILTLAEMPEVEVHILESDADPGGVGEPGLPPIAPAVANAVAAATGQRLRRLPLSLDPNHSSI